MPVAAFMPKARENTRSGSAKRLGSIGMNALINEVNAQAGKFVKPEAVALLKINYSTYSVRC
jgi:hypothetical protein